MVHIDEAYSRGTELLAKEHELLEAEKVGTLRGGNTGALLYGTTPIGQCARKAYLRYKGLSLDDIEDNRRLMFDAGLSNEDIWVKILTKGLPDNYKILREEDIPVVWHTPNGYKVTGRPDIVVIDEAGQGVVGIELKLVSALWTAKDILVDDKPKLAHMLQAGHYAHVLNLPWELWYTSRADFAVSREGWTQKLFNGIEEQYIETREQKNTRTGGTDIILNKILPFRRGYRLWWEKEQLLFTRIGGDEEPRYSIITWPAIVAYYEAIAGVDSRGVLPPRPKNINIMGKEEGYDMCDARYCKLSGICDSHELSLKNWLISVKKARQE